MPKIMGSWMGKRIVRSAGKRIGSRSFAIVSNQLGGIDWGSLVSQVASYKIDDLKSRRAAADAQLIAAQQATAMPTVPQAVPVKRSAFSLSPVVMIGGVALLGGAFFLLRKKR